MPNVTRGANLPGLLAYVIGPGRSDEHAFPHLVAGDETITVDHWSVPG
ncbi:hypothetical protein [Nocardia sp. BMG111209]|nr:hypothetical protein [Nocardia sp. BMG111209]